MTPLERRMMFIRGFGDGAKIASIKHPDNSDYMTGWERGRAAVEFAVDRFAEEHGLPPAAVLHEQRGS